MKQSDKKHKETSMSLTIYNSITRTKETFAPLSPGRVKMYVCGPTVYDSSHIGHARSVIVFDVIYRYLTHLGYEVAYVRNFTDIDDKIIQRAAELGMSTTELAETYIREFHRDMDALNVLRPTHEPRATAYISQIIGIIEALVQKGVAYRADGDVFFAVTRFEGYGRLSGRKLEDMAAGARVEVDARKHNPFDFVLWKAGKPGEPEWDSPWGKGRPGWHIECSAMSRELLGERLDIHGGGKDLIFPHHENEIAQSEAAFGQTFVKYWMHNGFVNINHEKMSKSLGNFLLIKDILKICHPEALRLFLLSHHYRSPVDFSDESIRNAAAGLDKLYGTLERAATMLGGATRSEAGETGAETAFYPMFEKAMNDDFNTAQAIGVLFDAARHLNKCLDEMEKQPADGPGVERPLEGVNLIRQSVLEMGRVLGLFAQEPMAYFADRRAAAMGRQSLDPARIDALVLERQEARKSRDFKKADAIRDQLKAMHIEIEDRPGGTVWKTAG